MVAVAGASMVAHWEEEKSHKTREDARPTLRNLGYSLL